MRPYDRLDGFDGLRPLRRTIPFHALGVLLVALTACRTTPTSDASSAPSSSASTQASTDLPGLEFERYRLDNGLEVILHQDRRLPLVAVSVWYHVGAINER
ncbi:MAG: hypothetical protein AAFN74_23110, partial [Myxococcota bacterium]